MPCTWKGWVVFVVYTLLTVLSVWFCPPEESWPGFLGCVFGLAAGMVAICWWTGEPLRWRWGRKGSGYAG